MLAARERVLRDKVTRLRRRADRDGFGRIGCREHALDVPVARRGRRALLGLGDRVQKERVALLDRLDVTVSSDLPEADDSEGDWPLYALH